MGFNAPKIIENNYLHSSIRRKFLLSSVIESILFAFTCASCSRTHIVYGTRDNSRILYDSPYFTTKNSFIFHIVGIKEKKKKMREMILIEPPLLTLLCSEIAERYAG